MVLGKQGCIVQVVSGVQQQLGAARGFGGGLAHARQHYAGKPHQMLHRMPCIRNRCRTLDVTQQLTLKFSVLLQGPTMMGIGTSAWMLHQMKVTCLHVQRCPVPG